MLATYLNIISQMQLKCDQCISPLYFQYTGFIPYPCLKGNFKASGENTCYIKDEAWYMELDFECCLGGDEDAGNPFLGQDHISTLGLL